MENLVFIITRSILAPMNGTHKFTTVKSGIRWRITQDLVIAFPSGGLGTRTREKGLGNENARAGIWERGHARRGLGTRTRERGLGNENMREGIWERGGACLYATLHLIPNSQSSLIANPQSRLIPNPQIGNA